MDVAWAEEDTDILEVNELSWVTVSVAELPQRYSRLEVDFGVLLQKQF